MEQFELRVVLNVSPKRLYDDWLDAAVHEQIIGAQADIKPELGYEFTMWDGYITGRNKELEPGKKIVQSWRTEEFPSEARDSTLTLIFSDHRNGTELILIHRDLQPGDAEKYDEGWRENYFPGLEEYYNDKL